MRQTCQASTELDGHRTEVLIQNFADRIFVLVTQVGKVGTLIQASIPATAPIIRDSETDPNTLPSPPVAIHLIPLMGSAPSEHAQTLHSLYTAQIATLIWAAEADAPMEVARRPVVVGIALRKSDGSNGDDITPQEREVFHGVMSVVQNLLKGETT